MTLGRTTTGPGVHTMEGDDPRVLDPDHRGERRALDRLRGARARPHEPTTRCTTGGGGDTASGYSLVTPPWSDDRDSPGKPWSRTRRRRIRERPVRDPLVRIVGSLRQSRSDEAGAVATPLPTVIARIVGDRPWLASTNGSMSKPRRWRCSRSRGRSRRRSLPGPLSGLGMKRRYTGTGRRGSFPLRPCAAEPVPLGARSAWPGSQRRAPRSPGPSVRLSGFAAPQAR